MISARSTRCRVRSRQRINAAAAKQCPVRTVDATALCNVQRSETSLAFTLGRLHENQRFFASLRMTTL